MDKCLKCGSENIIKMVPAASLVVPEVKQQVIEGKAEAMSCCKAVPFYNMRRCKDCGFRWDDLIEKQMKLNNK